MKDKTIEISIWSVKKIVTKVIEGAKWNSIYSKFANEENFTEFYGELREQLLSLFSEENLLRIAKKSRSESKFTIKDYIQESLFNFFGDYEPYKSERDEMIKVFMSYFEEVVKSEYPDVYYAIILEDICNGIENGFKSTEAHLMMLIDNMSIIKEQLKKNGESSSIITLNEYEDELKVNSDSKLSLHFFDFKDDDFIHHLTEKLDDTVIHIRSYSRSELLGYLLFLFKFNDNLDLPEKVMIINSHTAWNQIQKSNIEGNYLIANFRTSDEVSIIKNNLNIFIYDASDNNVNGTTYSLKRRTLRAIYEQLQKCGYESDDANDLVIKTNGNYQSIKRIEFVNKTGIPKWADEKNKFLLYATLLGGWEDTQGDRDVIEFLTDGKYEEFEEELRTFSYGEDPFVSKYMDFGRKRYKIIDPISSWQIIYNDFNTEIINNYYILIKEVFSDIDPKFDLDIEEHTFASIYGKIPYISTTLKHQMILSLTAMANLSKEIYPAYKDVSQNVIVSLLDGIKTEKQWFAISEYLNELVEVCPSIVINWLYTNITSQNQYLINLFLKKTSNVMFGGTYYTNILWALEKASNFPETVMKALLTLAKLSEIETEYTYANTPISILSTALSAWNHDISMSIDEKHKFVSNLILEMKYLKKTELLKNILPSRGLGGTLFPLTKPTFIPYKKNDELQYTHQIHDSYRYYLDVAIEAAEMDIEVWEVLLKDCLFVDYGLYEKTKKYFDELIGKKRVDNELFKLKKVLVTTIDKHRRYRKADWTLDNDNLEKLKTDFLDKIIFEDKVYDYIYLFDEYEAPIFIDMKLDEDLDAVDDYEHVKNLEEKKRIGALNKFRELSIDPMNLISKLSKNNYPQLGAMILSYYHDEVFNHDFYKKLIEFKKYDVLYSYIIKDIEMNGYDTILDLIKSENRDSKIYELMLNTISIDRVMSLDIDKAILKDYWAKYTRGFVKLSSNQLDEIIPQLVENRNYNVALNLLRFSAGNVELKLNLLSQMVTDNFNPNKYNSYDIGELLNDIHNKYYSQKEFYQEILDIEIYLAIAEFRDLSFKYLRHLLSTDFRVSVKFLGLMYKRHGHDDPVNDELKVIAMNARRIMDTKFCPLYEDSENFNKENVVSWSNEFIRSTSENGQDVIGRQMLGQFLANCPKKDDKYKPNSVIVDALEEILDEEIEKGYITQAQNSRGAYFKTDGQEEVRIAEMYQKNAKDLELTHPSVSSMLEKLARIYFYEAKRDMEVNLHEL